jgi:hypothetical protein
VVGARTRAAAGDVYAFEKVGEVVLDGKAHPVQIYPVRAATQRHVAEIHASELGLAQIRTRERGAAEQRAGTITAAQAGTIEPRPAQVAAREARSTQIRIGEAGAGKRWIDEANGTEADPSELGACQAQAFQHGTAQIGAAPHRILDAAVAEIGPRSLEVRQLGTAGIDLAKRGVLELGLGQPRAPQLRPVASCVRGSHPAELGADQRGARQARSREIGVRGVDAIEQRAAPIGLYEASAPFGALTSSRPRHRTTSRSASTSSTTVSRRRATGRKPAPAAGVRRAKQRGTNVGMEPTHDAPAGRIPWISNGSPPISRSSC